MTTVRRMGTRCCRAVAAGGIMLLLHGCATTRTEEFRTFAHAGRTYSQALAELTAEAAEAAVDADSEILLLARDAVGPRERHSVYLEHRQSLEDLMASMGALRRRGELLAEYFNALADLAGTGRTDPLTGDAAAIVAELRKVAAQLGGTRIGENAAKDFAGATAPPIVARFRNRALEQELLRHGPTIRTELALQEQLLARLADEVAASREAARSAREVRELMAPFAEDKRVPATWIRTRREILCALPEAGAAERAARASAELARAFDALSRGTPTPDLPDRVRAAAGIRPRATDSSQTGEEGH